MQFRSMLCVVLASLLALALLGCGEGDQDRQSAESVPDSQGVAGFDSQSPPAEPEEVKAAPAFAVGVDLTATADAEQEQTVLSLIQSASEAPDDAPAIAVDYPLDGSIFPPEMVAPTFLWHETALGADRWVVDVSLNGGSAHIYALSDGPPPTVEEDDPQGYGPGQEPYALTEYQASAKSWTPSEETWAAIKSRSVDGEAVVTILGYDSSNPDRPLSRGQMTLTTSADPVGAPIFYRDVPLLPVPAVKPKSIMPTATNTLPLIAWRLKDISRNDNRLVLSDMPTCANCHSFSDDGVTMGMDIDRPFGDKGAYALLPISQEMTVELEDIITWNSFADKPEGHKTLGFMARLSPDGETVVATVNEAIYIVNYPGFEFLQVFYPTRGILAYYSRQSGQFLSLPGADDPEFVHCGPTWSPDGKTIVFSRAAARDPDMEETPTYALDPLELDLQYDLYRIPFNDGQGGTPERIEGASENGKSNSFPKISPDGKWIVFVKSRNGQLMRPDSELWIVPVEGGEARKMTCNTSLMNSWHSFSPNGRWMVFSSKVNRPYTQMFLTHIDEDGNDSPPVLITNTTASNRAINLPEFVNIDYDDMHGIEVPAVEHYRHLTKARALMGNHEYEEAAIFLSKVLEVIPESARVNYKLALCLTKLGRFEEAADSLLAAIATDPKHAGYRNEIGMVLVKLKRPGEALEHLTVALEMIPTYAKAYGNRAVAHYMLGLYDEAWADVHKAKELEYYSHPDFIKMLQQASGRME
jgi:hypothetical protein